MAQRGKMFHITSSSSYHLDARQWLPADRIMQDEASKPIDLRPPVSGVINTIRADCFNNASKPSGNAIKKRYKKYFLGPEKYDRSLVEEADQRTMELIAYGQRHLTISQLVKEVRTLYFPQSPSALHTPDGIVKRYKTLEKRDKEKWGEADEWMGAFATQNADERGERFPIGIVVDHIKNEFFPTDLSVTRTHIEDRYCRKFLKIDNSKAAIATYDIRRVTEAMSMPIRTMSMSSRNDSSANISTTSKGNDSKLSLHESLPDRPKSSYLSSTRKKLFDDFASSSLPGALPRRLFPKPTHSRLETTKRVRPNSLTSIGGYAAYKEATASDPPASTPPPSQSALNQEQELEQILRTTLRVFGFWSASNANKSDTNSLISQLCCGSVQFKACPMDHSVLSAGGCCMLCSYPEVQPKPIVFLAPEYETHPQFTGESIAKGREDEMVSTKDVDDGMGAYDQESAQPGLQQPHELEAPAWPEKSDDFATVHQDLPQKHLDFQYGFDSNSTFIPPHNYIAPTPLPDPLSPQQQQPPQLQLSISQQPLTSTPMFSPAAEGVAQNQNDHILPDINEEILDPNDVTFMFIEPEYLLPPRADNIDADDMDNGIITMNANAMLDINPG